MSAALILAPAPRERGILFGAPMVRAILEGRKSVTRRLVKPQPPSPEAVYARTGIGFHLFTDFHAEPDTFRVSGPVGVVRDLVGQGEWRCPYGQPGDRLLVKESAWMWCERRPNGTTKTGRSKWLYVPMRAVPVHYCADHPELNVVSPETGNEWGWRKKLGRFLPAWASRITLPLTGVRVERVQDASEADILAEGVTVDRVSEWCGVPWSDMPDLHAAWRVLWTHINGAESWERNDWAWVLSWDRAEVRQ